MTFSPNILEIDLSCIEHNLSQIKKLVAPNVRIVGIVKSDAYGHGLIQVSRLLEKNNVPFLGVAHFQEAIELREKGIRIPIIVMCGIRNGEAIEVIEKDLTAVVFDTESAEYLNREALRKKKKIRVHIKIDTGMNRLGFPYGDSALYLKKIAGFKGLHPEGLMSHLSSADEKDSNFTKDQIIKFGSIIDIGREVGLDLQHNHLANSAGIMSHKDSHFSMVRPGIMLYGGLPSVDYTPPLPLKPAMRLKSEIIHIKEVPANSPVSYGRKYHTKGVQKVAVVAAGYGDGLSRSLSNRGKVLIRGSRIDIIGTVCMNMFMCDVSGLEDISIGDEVVILGTQKKETITGDDLARWSNTISYEIFSTLGQINSRKYI